MDLSLSAEDLAFREEVRAFLAENLSPEIARKVKRNFPVGREDSIRWGRVLNHKGWGAPGWPKEVGGTGWTQLQRHIFDMECRRGTRRVESAPAR